MPKDKDNTVGERWEEFLDICTRVAAAHRHFSDSEFEFTQALAERIAVYVDKAYISTAQINWLHRIEQKLTDKNL